jgi:hypothetical protein
MDGVQWKGEMARRKRAAEKGDAFARRTCQLYGWHRQRARKYGTELDYDLAAFRLLVKAALCTTLCGQGWCPFCLTTITAEDFGVDHIQPVARGGGHRLVNLTVCCQPCNRAKGPLTPGEYGELLGVIRGWPGEIARHTLARLKAGARMAKLNLRTAKAA